MRTRTDCSGEHELALLGEGRTRLGGGGEIGAVCRVAEARGLKGGLADDRDGTKKVTAARRRTSAAASSRRADEDEVQVEAEARVEHLERNELELGSATQRATAVHDTGRALLRCTSNGPTSKRALSASRDWGRRLKERPPFATGRRGRLLPRERGQPHDCDSTAARVTGRRRGARVHRARTQSTQPPTPQPIEP